MLNTNAALSLYSISCIENNSCSVIDGNSLGTNNPPSSDNPFTIASALDTIVSFALVLTYCIKTPFIQKKANHG